jgi:hypothetical protein
MNCGAPLRLPPRRPTAAGRIAGLVCLLFVSLAVWAGPAAGYYACEETKTTATSGRTRPVSAGRCAPRKPHGEADPASFFFVMGLAVAVLLIPMTALRGYRPDEEDCRHAGE